MAKPSTDDSSSVLTKKSKSGPQNQDPLSLDKKAFTVVKRNGSLVPFRKERIFRALEAAFRDTKKIVTTEPMPEDYLKAVEEVTDLVTDQVLTLASKGACLTVEGIQDVVEVTLMDRGYHDVARDYIIYRDQHKASREDSPQNLKIQRKDGNLVRFNPMKIASAIEAAFRRTRHVDGPSSEEIIEAVNLLTEKVVARAVALSKVGQSLDVSLIQDEIEQQLMRENFYNVAKEFILYRVTQGEQSIPVAEEDKPIQEPANQRKFTIVLEDKSKHTITETKLRAKLKFACRGLEKLVSSEELLEQSITNFYEEMKSSEVDLANIMAARAKIELEPAYSKVAARLLLDVLFREAFDTNTDDLSLEKKHREYFKQYLKHAISIERLHPSLLEFDLDKLGKAMQLSRDDQFSYLGLQTLYDRYFIHDQQRRMETPQIFWMRVAMGLALNEGEQKNERAIEFYDVLSRFLFTSGTPTLFNSGTMTSQLSSCYLSTVMDDLKHIFKVVADDAQLSKWAGGIGNDWSNVRATGAAIKGTNGKSQGVIPFLKVANDTAVAVNQCFHPDTRIFTNEGVKEIRHVCIGDLVLGISGKYRKVTSKYVYPQKDSMVLLNIEHSLDPIHVTSAHPFYAISASKDQTVKQTHVQLAEGKIQANWVDAGKLKDGDYVAQVIPKEIIFAPDFTEEDARFYGIFLANDGSLSENWQLNDNLPQATSKFAYEYLQKRNIEYRLKETTIIWAVENNTMQEATSGSCVMTEKQTLPFEHCDIYDHKMNKYIAPRFSHLPRPIALAMLHGMLEATYKVNKDKEIVFQNSSLPLLEGIRYQCLRFGIPTTGNLLELRIPIFAELAAKLKLIVSATQNWLRTEGFIWSRIIEVCNAQEVDTVLDLKVEGDESYMTTAGLAHNGGKRKGAMCAYLETWHLDIEDFLELRKNTGDERRRTHDMNTANWIPDLFMKRVAANGMWTLFSPSDVPDLHDLYGEAFETRYTEYEKHVEEGKIKLFKKIEAVQLWRKMLSMLFETGHPWITFKDPSNIRSPQGHVGVVHSSNLCTEILLNTSADETAVCNLGSINLVEHATEKGLDEKKLAATIRAVVRMLDNVIDINYYPTSEAQAANMRHRPIGLGLMGFQDVLYMMNISYASHEAVKFSDECMELISYYAILASSELAKERGTYSTYEGSKWSKGLLPIDTIALLEQERGGHLDMDRSSKLDWTPVRESVKKHGMRNSNTMAIAPTATIANITGITQSIEPMYKHLFVKSNLSGEFTIPNTFLVERLKKQGLWDQEMLDDLKYFDGSITEIERIPQEIKQVFLTAFEIDPDWLIECASRRQKWIDMGQSLNLYLAEPSGKKLHQMYMLSWTKGLKTNYYLRTLAATQIEKIDHGYQQTGLTAALDEE